VQYAGLGVEMRPFHIARNDCRGHHTIRSKSYAKGAFRSCLPSGAVLKEGFERKRHKVLPFDGDPCTNYRN